MRFGDADAISAVGARDDFHPELKALGRIAPRGNAGSATALKAVRRLMALRKSRVTGIDVVSLGNGVDVRIFRGGGRSSAQPALLWMHGGGYVAGVPCELVVVNGAFHGFDEVAPKAAVAQAFFAKQCLSLADAFRMS
ncbi:hypothetical protein GO011_33605 [Mycobacterium sp. 20091114027_K0903767]|nr:hypothetical protein [Mycobacterium sp. 20091114027_K0903767]